MLTDSLSIHKDSYKFIAIAGVLALIAFQFSLIVGILLSLITLWVIYFFRNPKRVLPVEDAVIVSPGEGTVALIEDVIPPEHFGLTQPKCTRVSIFLNIFDVHINRMPVTGKVLSILYHPGQFLNASCDKASLLNEKNTLIIEYGDKKRMAVSQIAGLIARRICCDVKEGTSYAAGSVFGLIRFGSRVDVYFDGIKKPLVQVGHKVRVGETALFHLDA